MVRYDCIISFGRGKTVELVRVNIHELIIGIRKAFLKILQIDIHISNNMIVNLRSEGKRRGNPILEQMVSIKKTKSHIETGNSL